MSRTTRHCYICTTCGTQHAPRDRPPDRCRNCQDDRQHVGWDGQRLTTHDDLATELRVRIERDHQLVGIGIHERFAIPERALLLQTPDVGNVLWDCVSVVTPEAVSAMRAIGGVDLIAISHPHFYASMVEWSGAFGGAPILIHRDDADWISRSSAAITHWHGERYALSPAVTLVHLPGHFPGSAALHWTGGPEGRSVLLAGDSLHVAADRHHITVMHSVPNYIPVGPDTIRELQRRLDDLTFDDLYGYTWGLNIIGSASAAVATSLDRYLRAISPRPVPPRLGGELAGFPDAAAPSGHTERWTVLRPARRHRRGVVPCTRRKVLTK